MNEIYKKPILSGRFTLEDAERITKVRLLEENPALSWELSDANRATRQAATAVGESADIATFLRERARIAEKMLVAKNPQIDTEPLTLTPPWWLTAGLAGVAFFAGLLTDQFSATGSRINLLSLPFFGILLWNILVYAMLFFSSLRYGDFLGLRRFFEFLEKRITTKSFRNPKNLATLMDPLAGHYAARAFHLAALCFVLGMIASVLLRGIGTAYTVGWESTWFAESPEIVYQIIALVYGICTNFLGPMPNILDVANMRFDRLAINGYEASASLWLMRMIVMLAIFVVIPRGLLALKHTFQIARIRKRFPLDLENRYFSNIMRTWRSEAMSLDLVVPDSVQSKNLLESAYRFAENLGFDFKEIKTHNWSIEDGDAPLTLEKNGQSQQVWVLFNATATPEQEVQGVALQALKEKLSKTPIILMVDLATYLARFGDLNDRIESRKELWRDFANELALPVIFYHSGLQPDDQTCDELKLAAAQAL